MTLKARVILVAIIGTVLGLTVSMSGRLLDAAAAARSVPRYGEQSGNTAEFLAAVIDRVQSEYVDQLDEQTLIDSAIRGIVEELDSHSRYLDSAAYEEIRISSSGNYSGVGLDVSLQDGRVTVIAPLEGAPAEAAGILPGDIVLAVDDVAVTASNYEGTAGRMRGAPGTTVTLDVQRDGFPEPLRFALKRADVRVKTVRDDYLGDGFGYVRLTGFSDSTADELDAAADRLRDEAEGPLRGLVLDLRNNPGGVLDGAVAVADRFLDGGLIVRGTGRIEHARFEESAKPGDSLEQVPLVVLVNKGSASASEIVAGAIKDHGRARIVGERTYGKGSVQTVMPLTDSSALKLTTARYLLPSGRTINGIGIEPDFPVSNPDPQQQFEGRIRSVPIGEDPQLQRALTVLGYNPIALSRLP